MKSFVSYSLVAVVASAALFASPSARAEDVNVGALVKDKILKCLHPTVKPEKATIEPGAPKTAGEITTTRVKVFYEGLIKKNAMELDVQVRSAGSIRQFKADVLSDSGVGVSSCAMTKTWTDF